MALVDYSSSASESDSSVESVTEERPVKRLKHVADSDLDSKSISQNTATLSTHAEAKVDSHVVKGKARNADGASASGSSSSMPPLPSAFHDLYASSVRQSVVDDPSLHQGRKRQIPHITGNWPSHLYIEFEQHDTLVDLLKEVEVVLDGAADLKNFLTSDLGAPTPLHISLSRPIVLKTAEKDSFLERITNTIRSSGTRPFNVTPRGLAWYKSPDSDRTFLILRVATLNAPANTDVAATPNPELVGLLTRCNTVATMFGQPALYQTTPSEAVGEAFHVSIAWTLGLPSEELSLKTLKLFRQRKFADIREWEIEVGAVKVKIGNVVNHVGLTGRKDGRAVDSNESVF